jgi:hypothetical protein
MVMSLPNIDMSLLDQPTLEKVQAKALDHAPRFYCCMVLIVNVLTVA